MSSPESHIDCAQSVDAAAYVLGALEDQERYREHLASCPRCRAEVAELRLVADQLPTSVAPVAAPVALRERVLAQARSEAELLHAAGPHADQPGRARRSRMPRISLAAAGAAMAAAAAIAAAIALAVGSSTPEHVRSGQVAATGAHASLREIDGRGELVVSGMPQPPRGKIYEVWLSHGAGQAPRPTDALFGVTGRGSGSVAVPDLDDAKEVLVTAEPLGGSVHPTSKPVISVAV